MRNQYDISQYMAARKKRTIMTALIIIFLIPITMFAGIYIFDDRKYLIISLLILIYTMLPFFMVFERRKPRAREIVMIAMMAALTACGNLICFMFGPFQAGTALVIISGISLGPEAGFLVGAIARFVVNFFSGQGPWTPWQMVCWGILGFLAGLVFNKVDIDKVQSRKFQIVIGPVVCIAFAIGSAYVTYRLSGSGPFIGWRLYIFGAIGLIIGLIIQRKRLPIDDITLPVYGFLTTFIIYGGIMNVAAMIMASAIPASGIGVDWHSLTLLYISGVPYDTVHGLGTAFFLFLFGNNVIRKMERVKIKFGLYR